VGTLVGLELAELLHRHAAILGESERGLRRRTLRIEAHGERRPAAFHLLVRLMFGQSMDLHGEAPRCREAANSAVANTGGIDAFEHAVGQRIRQAEQGARRQFLGEQLEQ